MRRGDEVFFKEYPTEVAGLVLVFLMLWLGRGYKRSGVMTNAEWMIYRFGNDAWGKFARVSQAVAAVIFGVGMLAYSFKGLNRGYR